MLPGVVLSYILLCYCLCASLPATTNEWYVSPVGNDSWSGRLPEPNQAQTDGPVASITRAATLVRERRDRTSPSVVTIAEGRYQQSAPLTFGAQDGGDSHAGTVTWHGAGQGAVLSFGVTLGNSSTDLWTKVSAQGNLWQRKLPTDAFSAGILPRQHRHCNEADGIPDPGCGCAPNAAF